jgi:hypothetical protein
MNLLPISLGGLTIFTDETLDSFHAEGVTVISPISSLTDEAL